jgi:hypothetical protein
LPSFKISETIPPVFDKDKPNQQESKNLCLTINQCRHNLTNQHMATGIVLFSSKESDDKKNYLCTTLLIL